MRTPSGASAELLAIVDDDPMWMQRAVDVSEQARKKGSQYPSASWILGRSSDAGSSVNATARAPRAALRWTSSAAATGSHRGTMHNGIRRPAESPHHSSIIQSLYAFTHAKSTALSLPQ